MAGTSYIYQFGEDCDPPYIQTDAQYLADAMRVQGWQPGIVRQEFLNKVDRQGNSIAAGLAAFMAAYESGTVDVTDNLSPTALSNILLDAISHAPLTTQPKFDSSQKAATTEFVNNALGNFSGVQTLAVNTALTGADSGKLILPTSAGLGFSLPLSSTVPAGTKFYFNGNGHGVAITRAGSDVINDGINGAITSVSLLEQDSVTLVSVSGGWSVIDGELHQASSSSFAGSLVTGGWKRLPGGLILQWDTGATVAGTVTKSFPTPFTTSCFTVTVNSNVAANWSNNECTVFGVDSATLTNTSYTIKSRLVQSGTVALNDNPFNMIAIGY